MVKPVGILALQGNFIQHATMVSKLGKTPKLVRYPQEIEDCSSLIIPGGESTTMSRQIDRNGFRLPIKEFSKKKPIMGTCAGMILLSSSDKVKNMAPLNIMNFTVNRNAWGSQVHSFVDNLNLNFDNKRKFQGTFIRAPKINKIGDHIEVIAEYDNEPVMLKNIKHLVCSFHPEIGDDCRIHKYFLDQVNG